MTDDARSSAAAQATPSPSPSPSSGPPSARSGRGSKWGRLLGSSSVDSASDTSTKVAVSRSLSARESLRESAAQGRQSSSSSSNGSHGQGNKVFPKAPKLSPGPAALARQDTIDETAEADPSPPTRDRPKLQIDREQRSSLEKQERMERNLSLERERQIELAASRATMSDTYDSGLREQPPTLAQRDLIATVMDMKVDVHLEMQRMSQRIGRLEDLLSEVLKRIPSGTDTSGQSTPAGGVGGIIQIGVTGPSGDEISMATIIQCSPSTSIQTPAIAVQQQQQQTTPSIQVAPPATTPPPLPLINPTGGNISSDADNNLMPTVVLKKRRTKARKAPPPPPTTVQSPDNVRIVESELPSTSTPKTREFL